MTDISTRLSAAVAERYAIERELGQGGMATVFLAHDLRHNRKVALKVLRPELAAMIGAERFLKEIELTANLQHPHILPLHDSGEAAGFLYYVMPYVEGETLRSLLDREKQLGIDRAVEIAKGVAAALDYAHRRGVIHRDIKPENVLLLDGQAMVADFGIALAVSQAGGNRLTETGLSLGTPHYMSPEQAMGDRVLDARSDVYSLGAMLYEMLAGDPPYTGGTAQAIVAKVITEKPAPLTAIRDTVPPNVAAAVHKALAKLPADRFASAAEFATALVTPGFTSSIPSAGGVSSTASGAGVTSWLRSRVPTVIVIAVLAVAAGWGWLRPTPGSPISRFTVSLPGGRLDGGIAISPDGSLMVIGGTDSAGNRGLYLRRLDQLESQRLSSMEDGLLPKFSPDGKEVSYLKPTGGLWRGSIVGSPPVLLADSAQVSGQGWGQDGNVYFIRSDGALARVPAGGGPAEVLLANDSALGVAQLLEPAPLPGGKGVLVTAVRSSGTVLLALDLKTRQHRVVVEGFSGRYVAPGRLLYATANGTLFQAPFDLSAMRLTGPAQPVASGLGVYLGAWADMAVSRTGTLAYLKGSGGQTEGNLFVAVNREGTERVLPIPAAGYDAFGISPDGKRVAAEVVEGNNDGGDIVTFGVGDSIVTRLTFRGINRYPTWTADGRRVAFSQLNQGERDLVWKPADGSGIEEPLLKRAGSQFEVDFSRDGRWMVYRDGDATGALETLSLRYRRMGAGGEDSVFYDSPRADYTPVLSPDGRWLAYTSTESGKEQVYVRPFPPQATGAVWQVSSEGGTEPVWSRSGGELFYRETGWLVAAEVKTISSFAVTARRRLFQASQYIRNSYHSRYAVLPGDREFLLVRPAANSGSQQAVVVLNWMRELPPK